MMRLRSTPLLLVAALAACQSTDPVSDASATRPIAAQVDELAENLVSALDSMDVTAFSNLMSPDVEYADFDVRVFGTDAVEERLSGILETFPADWDSAWADKHVDVLAPDAAILAGSANVTRRRNNGQLQETVAFLTAVVRLIDGEWLFTRLHWSGSSRDVDG